MVTYAQLAQTTTQPWRGGADEARKLARELEQYGADTDRHRRALSTHWSGADATVATGVLAEHAGRYRNAAAAYLRVDEVVSTLASEIDAAKRQLETAVSAAPSIPGRVGQDGTVHVNWEALGSPPSPAAVAAAQQRAMQVSGWIREAVLRANTADGNATAQLSSITGTQTGGTSTGSAVPADGTDPGQVNSWWKGLSPEQRDALIAEDPKRIGGLDGVPISARDQANRLALSGELDQVGAAREAAQDRMSQFSPSERNDALEYRQAQRELMGLNDRWENLTSIRDQLGRTDMQGSTEQLHLVDYDSTSDGRLVMAAGNPDTADNVVTFVPGMTTDVEGINGSMNAALRMQADAAAASPGQDTASVMWLGYDAPDGLLAASSGDYYREAAGDLTTFQQGLRATHEGQDSLNTLMGHSYGASTVGYAASQSDLGVDNLVFVASPGATVDSAADFQGLTADQVFATRGESDIIQNVPDWIHGNDPVDADFGGRVFPAGEGGHGDYWNPGSPAREGMTDIVTGRTDQLPVTLQDPSTLRHESVSP